MSIVSTMSPVHPNKIAFLAGQSILEATQPLDVDIRGTPVHVRLGKAVPWHRPRLPGDRPLPGLDDLVDDGWPPSQLLHCKWIVDSTESAVDLGLRLAVWRQRGPYEGHLALQVVTLPSNREVVWINLTKRIADATKAGKKYCPIPASFSLWTRTGERDARPLTDALTRAALEAGFAALGATQFCLLDVLLPTGNVSPSASDVFRRLVTAALIKLPFVTRGETGDVQGKPLFDISAARRAAAEVEIPEPAEQTPAPVVEISETERVEVSAQDRLFLSYVELSDFGPFEHFEWEQLARINVIVGENDCGKSHLLKAMYAITRAVEDFTLRSDPNSDQPPWKKVIEEKLVWTFEPLDRKLGRLVRRGAGSPGIATVETTLCNEWYGFGLSGGDKNGTVNTMDEVPLQPDVHALFLPPKEVLTSHHAILAVRDKLKTFGFDDTYVDLARALQGERVQAVLPEEFQRVLRELDDLFDGRIEMEQDKFFFKRGGDNFSMSQTAEGIKKIGILSRLIENGELRRNAILFLDEPEGNLHPKAARKLVKMLVDLSLAGVQIIVATHSYFVLKEFEILARSDPREPVMLCSLSRDAEGQRVNAAFSDLREGLPETAIRSAAVEQYEADIDVSWPSGKG